MAISAPFQLQQEKSNSICGRKTITSPKLQSNEAAQFLVTKKMATAGQKSR